MNSKNIVILVSGHGSNLQAILKACEREQWPCKIAAVISNRPQSRALSIAKSIGIPVQVIDHTQYAEREDFDAALAKTLDALAVDYVILAGFMRILTASFVNKFYGRLVNIHPSLLPSFPGLATHRAALAAGVKVHGCTIHFVSAEVDSGPIIAQATVPVLSDDTEQTLAARVLAQEHRLFPLVIKALVENRIKLEHGRVTVEGMPQWVQL